MRVDLRARAGAMAGVLALLGASCAAPGDRPDPAFDSSGMTVSQNAVYRLPPGARFTFVRGSGLRPDPRMDADLLDGLIRQGIVDSLEARGLRYASEGAADFKVAYVGALESALSDEELQKRFGVSGGWSAGDKNPKRYEKGTLIIDVVDGTGRRSLWRGSVQANTAFERRREDRVERIRRLLDSLFANLRIG